MDSTVGMQFSRAPRLMQISTQQLRSDLLAVYWSQHWAEQAPVLGAGQREAAAGRPAVNAGGGARDDRQRAHLDAVPARAEPRRHGQGEARARRRVETLSEGWTLYLLAQNPAAMAKVRRGPGVGYRPCHRFGRCACSRRTPPPWPR